MKQIEHSSLSKPIYDTLKKMILKKELKSGEKLIQEKIAVQLGVSRTPLMQALQMLEHELLVESIPRRGMFVRNFSIEEMIEVYYSRESIECMAVKLATLRNTPEKLQSLLEFFTPFIDPSDDIDIEEYKKADEEFHEAILEMSQNQVLKKMANLSQILSQVYSLGLLREPKETLKEHLYMAENMIAGNIDEAEKSMKNHIRLSREVLMKIVENV